MKAMFFGTNGTEQWVLLSLHILELVLYTSFFFGYIAFEIRRHGSKKLMSNRFVLFTLAGTMTQWLYLISSVTLAALNLQNPIMNDQLEVGLSHLLKLSYVTHIKLICLRTRAVFQSEKSHEIFASASMTSFFASTLIAIVLQSFEDGSRTIFIVRLVAAFVSSSLLGIIDVVASVLFSRHVKTVSGAKFNKTRDTSLIIADRSLVITTTSCLDVLLYWTYWMFYLFGPLQIATWIFFCHEAVALVVFVMWMALKVELDQVSRTAEAMDQTTDRNKVKSESM
eukprot:TRINITY_DN16626_c0_g2_i1.p1 TRINITY_DN16626_c0_g2~~TRINITY_DN16626_c0_g2_i1.p1  ORF type:complete len:282 (+),score=55.63 TRINITY_DN16626_c0_g2_i1:127-972(+)